MSEATEVVSHSFLLPLEFWQTFPQAHQRSACVAHFTQASAGDPEITLRSAATLRSGLSEARTHQSATLQPLQRCIHTGTHNLAARLFLEFAGNRHTVRVPSPPHEGQENHQFELTQTRVGAPFHLFKHNE